MKKKDITKYYKRKISSGWREYLDLKIPYKLLGIEKENYLTPKDIENLTGLKFHAEESGFVDHYNMIDEKNTHEGVPLFVSMELQWEYLREETVEEHLKKSNFLPDNLIALENDGKIYYCRGRAGYRNPEWTTESPKEVPYWLWANKKDLKPYDWFWTTNAEAEDEDKRIVTLLKKFINNKNFSYDLFSGNLPFRLVSGNCGDAIENELMKDLSELTDLCKTTYQEFETNKVCLTYAIRYKDYVKPFLKELKKITLKHKLPKLV